MMKTGFFGGLGFCARGFNSGARSGIQLFQGTAIALLLASTAQPAAASSVVVESDITNTYSFNDEPLMDRQVVDHGESGTIEASTSASVDPTAANEQGGQVIRLNSNAAGDLGAAHLEADAFYSTPVPSGDFDRYDSNAKTTFTITDLVLTGPTSQVTTNINFLLEGSLQASSEGYMSGSNNVSAASIFSATVQVGNGTDYPR